MKQKILALGLFVIIISCFLKVFYFCTDGFRVNKMVFNFTHQHFLPPADNTLDTKIVQQKFLYLGKGRQSYAFVSEDQKYVIKLVRYHKYQIPFWKNVCQQMLHISCGKIALQEQKERKKRAFESYLIAYQNLFPLTNVQYLHLTKTQNLKQKVTFVDRMGRCHNIQLDDVLFFMQKKADPLEKTMQMLYDKGQYEKVQKLIQSFYKMLAYRIKQNISNRDFMNYMRNSGIYHNQVMEIDVGSFYFNDALLERQEKQKEWERSLEDLERFLQQKCVNLLPFFLQQKAEFFDK